MKNSVLEITNKNIYSVLYRGWRSTGVKKLGHYIDSFGVRMGTTIFGTTTESSVRTFLNMHSPCPEPLL